MDHAAVQSVELQKARATRDFADVSVGRGASAPPRAQGVVMRDAGVRGWVEEWGCALRESWRFTRAFRTTTVDGRTCA